MSKEPEYLPEHHEDVDEWHAHTPDEGRPQHEHASHVNSKMLGLAFLAIVGSVLFVTVIIIVYFNSYAATLRAKKVETLTWAEQAFEEKTEKMAVLDDGGVPPGDESVEYVPLDEAMDTVIREYADMRADAN